MTERVELPRGYVVRSPTERDSGAITEIVVAEDVANFGEPDFTETDLLDDWGRPRFDLRRDAWVVTGPTARVIAYAFVWEAHPGEELEADAFVLPEYAGRGLGTHLVDRIEDRAAAIAARAGCPLRLGLYAARVNEAKRTLLTRRGYRVVRTSLRLKVDLAHRPPRPVGPPAGVELRRFRSGEDDDAVRDTMAEALAGHHRFTTRRLDEWLELRVRHPAFDPDLWRVACHDGEVIGAVLVFDVGGTGYLSNVGVREAWRGRGVAQALLHDALAALRERGQMRVLVSLDADAAPAAARLYEEAGMRVHEQHDWFEKVIQPRR